MKVKELIKKLKKMDQGSYVYHLWDGELRTEIDHVYMGKEGHCVTAGGGEVAYSNDGRPINAPTEKESQHWKTDEVPYIFDDER